MMCPQPPETTLAIEVFLERLTAQLDGLVAQVFELERTMGETFADQGQVPHPAIIQLQTLDFLRQSLEDLALLTSVSAGAIQTGTGPQLSLATTAEKLRLDTTRAILSTQNEVPVTPDQNYGDLDLF
ncbi:MAG: hypothetical protein ACSHWZ_09020 [Sulfitobacter sp.]